LLFLEFVDDEFQETIFAKRGTREVDCQRVASFFFAFMIGEIGQRGLNHPAI